MLHPRWARAASGLLQCGQCRCLCSSLCHGSRYTWLHLATPRSCLFPCFPAVLVAAAHQRLLAHRLHALSHRLTLACRDAAAAYLPRGGLYLVYILICTANGRIYIGYTRRSLRQRKAEHSRNPPRRMRADAKRLRPFEQHFQAHVPADAASKREAELLEEYFIWKFGATEKHGYNSLPSASTPMRPVW